MSRIILVVDDDDDILIAVGGALDDEGYQPVCVRNGAAALDYLRSSPPPCLILLDLVMPVMDGWAFREAQQREPGWAGIRIALMTALANLEQRACTADHVLQKPLRVDALLRLVAAWCPPPACA